MGLIIVEGTGLVADRGVSNLRGCGLKVSGLSGIGECAAGGAAPIVPVFPENIFPSSWTKTHACTTNNSCNKFDINMATS